MMAKAAVTRRAVRTKISRSSGSPDSSANSSRRWSARLNLRQYRFHVPARELIILKLAGEVAFVRSEIEVAMPAEAEQDRTTLAFFARGNGFIDGGANGVRR